jgi:hypothetical protein
MSPPVIAPELAKALETPDTGATALNVFLKVAMPEHAATPALRAAEAAKIVLRVGKQSQEPPKFQFRDTDCVLQVKANKDFVRELVRQPEILEAKQVPSFSSAMIEPAGKRDVDASKIDTAYSAPRRTTPRGNR